MQPVLGIREKAKSPLVGACWAVVADVQRVVVEIHMVSGKAVPLVVRGLGAHQHAVY